LRLERYRLFALGLVTISVGIGEIGYDHFGENYWLDNFHLAFMILTGMAQLQI
jgi:hypothetical protein